MFIDLRGRQVNVMSFGKGGPPLIAHGGFAGNYELWLPPFELLSRRIRTITYDHRGAGESHVDPATITPDAMVQDLFDVMDAMGLERAVVAGESMGAGIVLKAALESPERFLGLVLVDGAPAFTPDRSGRLAAGCRAAFEPTLRAFIDGCVPEPDSEHIKLWGMHILTRSTPEMSARLLECMWGLDLSERLGEIRLPTLVIHGAADAIVPPAAGQMMAARIPGARLVLIDGAGHVPTLTFPERVAREIESFLDRLPPADSGG